MNEKSDKKPSKLSALYKYKGRLEIDIGELEKEVSSSTKKLKEKQGKLVQVNREINYINSRGLLISTHALQRYKERVDPEATEDSMRERVITPEVLKQIEVLGGGILPVEHFHIIVNDNKLITVITPMEKKH